MSFWSLQRFMSQPTAPEAFTPDERAGENRLSGPDSLSDRQPGREADSKGSGAAGGTAVLEKEAAAVLWAASTLLTTPPFPECPASVHLRHLSWACCKWLPGSDGIQHLSGGAARWRALHLPGVSVGRKPPPSLQLGCSLKSRICRGVCVRAKVMQPCRQRPPISEQQCPAPAARPRVLPANCPPPSPGPTEEEHGPPEKLICTKGDPCRKTQDVREFADAQTTPELQVDTPRSNLHTQPCRLPSITKEDAPGRHPEQTPQTQFKVNFTRHRADRQDPSPRVTPGPKPEKAPRPAGNSGPGTAHRATMSHPTWLPGECPCSRGHWLLCPVEATVSATPFSTCFRKDREGGKKIGGFT